MEDGTSFGNDNALFEASSEAPEQEGRHPGLLGKAPNVTVDKGNDRQNGNEEAVVVVVPGLAACPSTSTGG